MAAGAPEVAAEVRRVLEAHLAPRKTVPPESVGVMLAETVERPFSGPGWLFELKYDGFRVLAARTHGEARLLYRRGGDATATYPEIARAVAALPFDHVIVDAEVVVLDDESRPSFQGLQKRALLQRGVDIARAAVERPATLFVFDLLAFEDFDLRGLPLFRRKELLRRLLSGAGPVRYTDHIAEQGAAFYAEVSRLGLEGIVAKRADSPYRAGRSKDWLKIRVERTADFVVVGLSPPQGTRSGFGALHLGAYEEGRLTYVGRVGTGFTEADLRDITALVAPDHGAAPACAGPVPGGRGHVWLEPRHVCEVRYKEWTADGLLRQPVFLRLRADKAPEECTADVLVAVPGDAEPAGAPPPAQKRLAFSTLGTVLWPQEGYTRGDLIEFYRAVAPWLLPYLRDRPVALVRAPGSVPHWVHVERIRSESAQREIDHVLAGDVETLLWLVDAGTIALHVWSGRVPTLQQPDWCLLDLDPAGAPFADVVRVALALRDLCDDLHLPSFVKTGGTGGLHVLVPLGRQLTCDQARLLGELMAAAVSQLSPRGGVRVDASPNRHGQLVTAPYSVSAAAGAPVSTPLRWDEVGPGLDPSRFTIRTVPDRLAGISADPLRPVLDEVPDLVQALERLRGRLSAPEA